MSREVIERLFLSLLLAAGFVMGGTPMGASSKSPTAMQRIPARFTLRIGVWTLWHDREVVIAPAVKGRVVSLKSCDQCATTSISQPTKLRADGDAVIVTLPGGEVRTTRITVIGPVAFTAHGETIAFNDPVTITARNGLPIIVATLPIERYVQRVVASESGPSDTSESLKALAIVVRTFALHVSHGHADYDLCDSTHCQLLHWKGNLDRDGAAHAATLATTGETLWFHGGRALAYFSKDCGGHTASPAEVWTHARPLAYLPSKPDQFCAGSGSEWASELTHAELTAALAAERIASPGWKTLTVASRGESGRAVTIRLDATEVSAEDFCLAVGKSLGWNRIPSTWFEVSQQGDRFQFHGRGMGHGVGLCQRGAAAMAAQSRSNTRQILAQYFPGAEPADETSGIAWQYFAGQGFELESLDASDAEYLPSLARARAEASQRSGLNTTGPFTVRAFATTQAFRDDTLAPGWVAAFTEGDWIGTQPLRTLAARRLLDATLLHEFLHALIEREAGSHTPLWLREGLVEVWSEAGKPLHSPPNLSVDETNAALAHPENGSQSEAAHRAAGWYAARLLDRYERAQVLTWLRSGIPGNMIAGIGQR